MRKLCVTNVRGGVGKTATILHLAEAMVEKGYRVLLVDMDSQAHLTLLLRRDGQKGPGIGDFLLGEVRIQDLIVSLETEGLYLLPASSSLATVEAEMRLGKGWERKLEEGLKDLDGFDLIFFDTPSLIGTLLVNVLVASEDILIPIRSDYLAFEGLFNLLRTIKLVKTTLNPRLTIVGFLLSLYDPRLSITSLVEEEARRFFGIKVLRTVIPQNSLLREAFGFGRSILSYAPGSRGAQSFLALADELSERWSQSSLPSKEVL